MEKKKEHKSWSLCTKDSRSSSRLWFGFFRFPFSFYFCFLQPWFHNLVEGSYLSWVIQAKRSPRKEVLLILMPSLP
ncbi:hypothetical protein GDO81_024986 [Engystomops pustulosus]|uniref:Uncharacterized protein n=1 Tax=Engystomops pustulosus TaxID=76066 RepID=A0AAV6YTR1_ENGPU|nr:hypothetical protein GDO81_024986 [Engystomops pustulosus]